MDVLEIEVRAVAGDEAGIGRTREGIEGDVAFDREVHDGPGRSPEKAEGEVLALFEGRGDA